MEKQARLRALTLVRPRARRERIDDNPWRRSDLDQCRRAQEAADLARTVTGLSQCWQMSAMGQKRHIGLHEEASAFLLKADIVWASEIVGYVPEPDSCSGCEAILVSFCASPLRTRAV
jgi:hypothetical protein